MNGGGGGGGGYRSRRFYNPRKVKTQNVRHYRTTL
jgi:hypothetical protein